ncbi:Vacuolar protein sorting-associated protein ist1 [Malassezia cuniculi]|uniref:Vacuolar protein sorting-associated protein ist1 n=1 Tax=Malassezia cuniculi TaxID=948313 RepID=A0AAF0EVJ8_9BASI|nr:Vacuolar protein sorting-associated protein ist1 [Malassezia cuniculi]
MPWLPARTRVQLRLVVQRTHMLIEKKNALAKRARYEVADLVRTGKLDTARIRTENMIIDDMYIEALELIELYAETVSSRFALVERAGYVAADSVVPDPAIAEQVAGLMYAAPYTDIRELHSLLELFGARYGKEYAAAVVGGEDVSERITKRLTYTVPPPELVEAYLSEICRTYSVRYGESQGGQGGQAAGDEHDDESESVPAEKTARPGGTDARGAAAAQSAPAAAPKNSPGLRR